MSTANEMKALLLGMLETAFQPADIQATQQMGVNMSNAAKRDGVVIIQNQSVEVYSRIMPSMVKALKLCDSFEPVAAIAHQPLQIAPPVDEDPDPIDACCAFMYEQNIGWEAMQDLMKARYAEYVVGKNTTKIEAAKMLGIGPTYLCKITSLLKAKKVKPAQSHKMTII